MDSLHTTMMTLAKAALAEDVGRGDITTLGCLEPNRANAQVVAKSTGVLSGLELFELVFCIVDSANRVLPRLGDSNRFAPGDIILDIEGFNQTILIAERVALNFLARCSGIATLTRQFVDRISSYPGCTILDTRKTTPGWRQLEKLAVRHGGGHNHRMGLYDMALIKDNHIAAAGSIKAAVTLMREYLTSRDFRLTFDQDPDKILIEVEVTTLTELDEALGCRVDRLLLDNQSPNSLRAMVARAHQLNPAVKLEASGNVTLANVAEIAATGVDFISVGALTHSAPASDFSLRIVGC